MLDKMRSEKWTLAKHKTARDLKINCIAFIANSEGLISMDYFTVLSYLADLEEQ